MSALPSHPPKVCLVSKHLVEVLLLIWMLMLVGHRKKISNICFKTVIGPALDELGIRPFGPERAPSDQIRNLNAVQDCEENLERAGIGGRDQKVDVPPTDRMPRSIQIEAPIRRNGLEPVQLLVQGRQAADQ